MEQSLCQRSYSESPCCVWQPSTKTRQLRSAAASNQRLTPLDNVGETGRNDTSVLWLAHKDTSQQAAAVLRALKRGAAIEHRLCRALVIYARVCTAWRDFVC